MIEKTFTIQNKYGIHARPAGLLVKAAARYKSSIYISKNGNEVNAKSIMGVLMLEASSGCEVILRISGEDENEAIKEIEELIKIRKFDED